MTIKKPGTLHCICFAMMLTWMSLLNAQAKPTGHPPFMSPHSKPIVVDHKSLLFVTNTPADTIEVIDSNSLTIIRSIAVGIDPVGLALKPDHSELWVANHVSDSISIIDNNPDNTTYLHVIATIQDFDPTTGATRFDEPVGIAFAGNNKAYVSLSSENHIAVIDANAYRISNRLSIPAQDPRAMFVRDERLFVIPFESNNQTQISGCAGPFDAGRCTFDGFEHVVTNNNVLSQNITVDIIKHPQVPDRDLFIFDTNTDQLLSSASALGTLLYGITVDSTGQVYIAQTDARNDANGAAGTLGDGLAQMGNRAFLNQITKINCSGATCTAPEFINLEPLPPNNPATDKTYATPFAIQNSDDDAVLLVTAASSNKLFIIDKNSNNITGETEVGKVPRGIAIASDANGQAHTAWVLNVASNSISQVDVSDVNTPQVTNTINLFDPTHPEVKLGRIAFNDAKASTTGTFSCESCHPDGGTDQLTWILDTPLCNLPGCSQIPPRVTMPIRGLRDTAPYHWDGIPGDPYGGPNTSNINGFDQPNCALDEPESCTRFLVDGGLASTMCMVGACPVNNEGKSGALTATERDAMAQFLLSVPYPPAQRRSHDNVLTERAKAGFQLFHVDGDLQGNPQPNVCGDCHRMPFWVSTNTPGTGMEAPTWRGAYDRWLILPQGRLNIIGFNFFRNIAETGLSEELVWRLSWASRPRFNPVWNMITEGSTGFSGAFGRQLPLNKTALQTNTTQQLFLSLEQAADDDAVLLQGEGVAINGTEATPVTISYGKGLYQLSNQDMPLSRDALIAQVNNDLLVATLTAQLGDKVDVENPQPALWTAGPMHLQVGRQNFPSLQGQNKIISLSGRHIQTGAHVFVDGKRVAGMVRCAQGNLPTCVNERLEIQLASLPANRGMHFIQVQNHQGLMSNDFIFYTNEDGAELAPIDVSGPWYNSNQSGHGWYLEKLAGIGPDQPERLLAYWYVYQGGAPVWLIGQGELVEGRAQLSVFSTSGTSFPPQFVADDVIYQPWGELTFDFADHANGSASWHSDVTGFSSGSMNITKLAAIKNDPDGCFSGSYYNPQQSGHGIGVQIVNTQGQANILLAWYTYHEGRQIWLVGQAPFENQQATVSMFSFNGGDFPPAFDPAQVSNAAWGEVTIAFTDHHNLQLDWNSIQPGFGSGQSLMTRLTQLSGYECN